MQRDDDGIRRGAGGGNKRKEVRCRNGTHVTNFLSSGSFEQGKKVERVVTNPLPIKLPLYRLIVCAFGDRLPSASEKPIHLRIVAPLRRIFDSAI